MPHDIAAPIRGSGSGPLAGLTVAVKDTYDIAGQTTGGGSPEWLADQAPAGRNAAAIERLLAGGADIIGKTVCDEFFFNLTGANAHYGTPVNVRAPGRFPGGSSSGSAAAVAAGACDIALGSDTGGSVRVPGGFCGIYGIRPTHGRVDAAGAMAMSPSFDTVGWFAHSAGLLRKTGAVLLEAQSEQRRPLSLVLVLQDALDQADAPLASALREFLERASSALPPQEHAIIAANGFDDWRNCFRTIQGREIWAIYGTWIEAHKPHLGPGIRERMAYAATISEDAAASARKNFSVARADIRRRISPGTVAALPSAACISPRIDATPKELDAFRGRTMALTSIAGIGGLPQITIPIGTLDGCPIGLSLIGWPGADETLLDLAVALAPYCGAAHQSP
ncbi:MAG: amidase [Alphaproteobacteria bacterium]|nr:amidase [Alphaproteobacteria bacterium]